MDIVVINLASHPQRWDDMRRRCDGVALPVQRLEACDGAGAPGYDPALNRRRFHKPLRPGEIGCYASHRAAWQQLVDSGARALAVFEDDIEFDADLARQLQAIERLPMPWDMVKLYGRAREHVAWQRPLVGATSLIGYRRVPSHTCAYVISRQGALRLLASRARFGRPLDVDLRHWWENGLVVLGLQPYPVRPAPAAAQPTIDDGRRGCSSAAMRLRKIALQLRYAALNWRHTAARARADGGAWSVQGRLPVPVHPSHGDLV